VRIGLRLAGRFTLERQAAVGGMGTIYRARDHATGATVAVKVVGAEDVGERERFLREAALLAELDHPAIVRYIAHGEADGGHYLVMEWIEGETLAQRLHREGVTVADSVDIGIQVADALAAAHARGVLHRDIKPDNLLFPDGQVKLVDFGLARRTRDEQGLTASGVLLGTPGYMAPEQAEGLRDLDERVDLFALGCVLHECLTGRAAYEGKNQIALRAKILLGRPALVRTLCPEAPVALEALLEALLERDRRARPRSAGEVGEVLRRLVGLDRVVRRRTMDPGPPTLALRRPHDGGRADAVCVVMAISRDLVELGPPAALSGEHGARVVQLERAVAPFDGRLAVLADGSVVVALAGGTRTAALRGARCAIALRGELADAVIIVVSEPAGGDVLDGAIERGVQVAEQAALKLMFAHGTGAERVRGAIRIDAATAAAVGDALPVARVDEVDYLEMELHG
jgi:hypothetical protein